MTAPAPTLADILALLRGPELLIGGKFVNRHDRQIVADALEKHYAPPEEKP